ncbi:MAG: 4Fe-4S binding protein [Stomatobaculum sp.]|nr:4Fe-4S binding protein [Stomatobaculum sp.]
MASKRYAVVDQSRCVSCGACTKECPKGAITVWKGCWAAVDTEACVGCGKCSRICPADVISMKAREVTA